MFKRRASDRRVVFDVKRVLSRGYSLKNRTSPANFGCAGSRFGGRKTIKHGEAAEWAAP
jgi:hypothetical protein